MTPSKSTGSWRQPMALLASAVMASTILAFATPAGASPAPATTARATTHKPVAPTTSSTATQGTKPMMCTEPWPPDYAGCSLAQIRALQTATRVRDEITGHAFSNHYANYLLGAHHKSILAGMRTCCPRLWKRYVSMFHNAVLYYHRWHTHIVTAKDGTQTVVHEWPEYRHWSGFAAAALSGCSSGLMGMTPGAWCIGWWNLNGGDESITDQMWDSTHIVIGCAGFGATMETARNGWHGIKALLYTGKWVKGGYMAGWPEGTAMCLADHHPVGHATFTGIYNWFHDLF